MSAHTNTQQTQNKKYSLPSNKKNKKYENDINLFPVLLKEQEHSHSNNSQKKSTLSFASLVNNEKNIKVTLALKEEEAAEAAEAVKPGWVLIKKINGKINYKYGIMSDAYVNMILENKRQEKEDNKNSFKKRLAQLQWDRDILNDLLGDISPHWNTKTLYETYNLEHLIKKKNKNNQNNQNNQKANNEENEENEENNQKDDEWICI